MMYLRVSFVNVIIRSNAKRHVLSTSHLLLHIV